MISALKLGVFVYLNGILQTSTSGGSGDAPIKTSVDYVVIGGRKYSTSYGRFFQGKIGSVVVYEKSLTSVEILSNYSSLKKKYNIN